MVRQNIGEISEIKMKSKDKILKVCEFCGNTFEAGKITTRYCSHSCNSRAYKANKREWKLVTMNHRVAQEVEMISDQYEKIKDKEFLSVSETAFLLSVGRMTVYRHLHSGYLKAVQIGAKTFIRRKDIDDKFDAAESFKAKPSTDRNPISELCTVAEIKDKYKVNESWIFRVAKENNFPRTLNKGKTYFSRKHVDAYFSKKRYETGIAEWYSVDDIKEKYNMTTSGVYTFVYENNIPKKKEGKFVYYSKVHVDKLKSEEQPAKQEYYTIPEAMEKYNMSRDQIYHYVKYHNVPKVKVGKFIKISRPDLDRVLENPLIL
ncbi:MAG: helix-turn-helix domain-containing protein [Prevotella sp.]|jgi:excisionase family DNA binding protein|nr:helix-turn-helix domain-containing protein [Prevotella sp.]